MRDKEDRVRFSGYDVANLKTFVFVYGAVLSAIGGAMFTLQVGFMSPSFVGIVPSIEMVICAAVGGREWLLGAVYGTLLVNYGKTFFSEKFPELWLFLIGALFIGGGDGVPQRPGRACAATASALAEACAARLAGPRGAAAAEDGAAWRAPPMAASR